MYGATLLTREVVESFKKRFDKTGQRSCITFTSAMAAITPIPGLSLYSATKIYTDYVTQGLSAELAKYKIDVSGWRAMGVSTNMTNNTQTNVMVATPELYVKRAMSKVTSGVHAGYFPHELVGLFWTNVNDLMPQSFCTGFFKKLLEMHDKELKKAH